MKYEIRAGVPAEIRATDDGIKVSGHAAVFNQEADIGGMFREVILPGAFAKAIKRDDVVFLANHEGLPLARNRSGTLKLTEDGKGLHIETVLNPDDPDVRAVTLKMERGDLDKMSFSFRALVQEWDDTEDPPLRTISEAELFDVSVVTHPAFDGTDIGLRSLERHRDEKKKKQTRAYARRVRIKGNLTLMGGRAVKTASKNKG